MQHLDQFETYEVFSQKKRGEHHMHVGSLHAPNAEMALLFAKEQYGRRGVSVNMWVVKTADVFATDYEDEDIFATVPDKQYREAGVYKVVDRITKFKEEQAKQPQ
ncbi:MAG TPA: 1,2-phenylacetyl-CoA epoxidase subunit PaaB [Bacteroidia bacterium]|nr:1,2-phenylacetyl-CoA epoxidase subunit PaaB [Bacteroidia bacterium]